MRHASIAIIIITTFFGLAPIPAFAAEPISSKTPDSKVSNASSEAASDASEPETRASAGEPRPHQPGFYASVRLGVGYGSFGSDFEGADVGVSGAGVAASILCGGMLVENLALVGDLEVLSLPNPTLKFGDTSTDTEDVTASWVGLGPGVVYYIAAANVSLGASLLLTRMSISQDDEAVGKTDLGLGGKLGIGKEWAFRKGSVGIVGDVSLSTMQDKDDGPRWTATTVGVSAAYTYN